MFEQLHLYTSQPALKETPRRGKRKLVLDYLEKHPGVTARTVYTALKLENNDVHTILALLERAHQVRAEVRTAKDWAEHSKSELKHYWRVKA